MSPSTPSTREEKALGSLEVPMAAATDQHASRKIQRMSEPECEPHTAATR